MKTINKNNGRFYVVDEERGIHLPSVTTILSEMSDKTGLEEWRKRVGEKEADKITKFAANRGTFMHSLHEHYLDSRFVNNEEKPLQQAFIKAMKECSDLTKEEQECGKNLFLQFHNTTDFYERIDSVMFQEVPLWSFIGGGYAGRMDLAIYGKPNLPKVIDFKTSKKPKKEEWISNYKKQVAAYSIALHERHGIFPHSCEIWISCETGEVQMFELNREEIKHWFSEFHKDLIGYHEKLQN